MSIRAIQTEYNNYSFRSRLEARWAVFFDALGVRYEYEKEGFHLTSTSYEKQKTGYRGILMGDINYLPDFYLPDHSIWVEIKGASCSDDDMRKCQLLQLNNKQEVYIAEGEIGNHKWIGCDITTDDDYFDFRKHYSVNRTVEILDILERVNYDTNGIPWGWKILCPICKDQYIDLESVIEIESNDEYGHAWMGRGAAIRVLCYCSPCGTSFVIRFGFHKGRTYVACEDITKGTDDICLWLANGDEKRKTEAVNAARSARFEHGETPKVQRGRIKKGK